LYRLILELNVSLAGFPLFHGGDGVHDELLAGLVTGCTARSASRLRPRAAGSGVWTPAGPSRCPPLSPSSLAATEPVAAPPGRRPRCRAARRERRPVARWRCGPVWHDVTPCADLTILCSLRRLEARLRARAADTEIAAGHDQAAPAAARHPPPLAQTTCARSNDRHSAGCRSSAACAERRCLGQSSRPGRHHRTARRPTSCSA
jgi:hypothetical protein